MDKIIKILSTMHAEEKDPIRKTALDAAIRLLPWCREIGTDARYAEQDLWLAMRDADNGSTDA